MKTFDEYERWLSSEYIPIAGGESVPSPPSEPEPPPDPQPGDDPPTPPEPQPDGDMIPKARFDQVYWQFKQYQGFGKLDELKDKLARLERYEKALEDHRKTQGLTDDQRQARANAERIKSQLLEIFPGLANLDKIGDLEQSTIAVRMEKASSHLEGLLKTNNISVSEKVRDRLEDYILASMSQEETQSIVKGDFEAIDRIFNDDLKEGLLAQLKTKPNGNPPPQPPKRHGPGGTAPKPGEKAKTGKELMDFAESAGFERLTAAGKGE